MTTKRRADLTYKYNQKKGRHGWLRLTPAYSVKTALKYLNATNKAAKVLDPFSGTGTTGLLCSEVGMECHLVEVNPFLAWFAQAKTRNYTIDDIRTARELVNRIVKASTTPSVQDFWTPPIRFIERWWSEQRLAILAQIFHYIQAFSSEAPTPCIDLIKIAFCRLIIQWSNAAFNHQSMSFKENSQQQLFPFDERDEILSAFQKIAFEILQDAQPHLLAPIQIFEGDSRQVAEIVNGDYSQVITSPPYPNRMSYIRELRPYMYWLGFLTDPSQAGELDWKAIGGTWGVATSRLTDWVPDESIVVQHEGFYQLIDDII